jgi:hypothetical protein
VIISTTPVILSHFEDLTDPRMERTKRHLLIDMVAIALCAAICGAEGWADVERFGKKKREWFARFLELPNGIPSHDTFGRVFARLDSSEFYACLQRWIRSLNQAVSDHGVRLDGKTLRHSFDTAAGKDALHLLSARGIQGPTSVAQRPDHARRRSCEGTCVFEGVAWQTPETDHTRRRHCQGTRGVQAGTSAPLRPDHARRRHGNPVRHGGCRLVGQASRLP